MDGTEVMIDPHNEVRKLQELVKKLEKQNEVLRSKTPGANDSDSGGSRMSVSGELNGSLSDEDLLKNKLREHLKLADLEDVDYLQLPGEEDGWLYKPPSRQSPSEGSEENLVSWIRQDFDHPTPERESSKRALVHFIEEAARMKHSSSSPMLGSESQNSKSSSMLSRSAEDNRSIAPPSSRLASLQKSGIHSSVGGHGKKFDSGTFTRPKRPGGSNLKAPFLGEGDQVQNVPNVADIENLAKQQEESLRQSVTPAKNPLRNKHPLVEVDGARTSPSRFDVEGSYMSQHRGSFSSDQSTPPDSPHNSQHFQLSTSNDGRVRRNLPSAPGLQYRSHNSSDSSLERHSVDTNGSDEMNLAPEAMRAPSSRLQPPRNTSSSSALPKRSIPGLAPGLAKPQQRGVSPQRQSGLPTARRQIARPSSAPRSSLPQFRRPVTPSSRPAPTQSQDSEANWRDGCF